MILVRFVLYDKSNSESAFAMLDNPIYAAMSQLAITGAKMLGFMSSPWEPPVIKSRVDIPSSTSGRMVNGRFLTTTHL